MTRYFVEVAPAQAAPYRLNVFDSATAYRLRDLAWAAGSRAWAIAEYADGTVYQDGGWPGVDR